MLRLIVGRSISKIRKSMMSRDLNRMAQGGAERGAERVEARMDTVTSVLKSLASALILMSTFLLILGEMNVSLAPLLASAGVAGAALGFGAQYVVRDVLAGIFVLTEDQYGLGDWINTGTAEGTVEGFTLRATQIRDASGAVWHIPNGSVEGIGNLSQKWSRAVVEVVVTATTDIEAARAAISDVVDRYADSDVGREMLVSEPVDQGIVAMNQSGITLRVIADTLPSKQWAVERELRQRIKSALDEAGISLQIHHMGGAES